MPFTFSIFRRPVLPDLEVADDVGAVAPGDREAVVEVIEVAVRDQHEVDRAEVLVGIGGRGIVIEPRVHEHRLAAWRVIEHGRVAEPGDREPFVLLHEYLPGRARPISFV
jgi:hypothetical protein